MYLSHFGFRVMPFNVTPDPGFLYLSPGHREALGVVRYGVEQRKGLVTLVGEVGTGKTTILRAFLERHAASNVKCIYILDPRISFNGVLRTVLRRFGLSIPEQHDTELLLGAVHKLLLEQYVAGNTVALLIDEAQRLPRRLLENLRLLTNLETNREKLFQIVLVGQPELAEMLADPRLRQVNQRVAVRAWLGPLSRRESRAYIAHRLQRAARVKRQVFTPGALRKIVAVAEGIPRRINIICDNVLIAAYAHDEIPVTARRVRRVLRTLVAATPPWRQGRFRRPAAALLTLSAVAAVAVFGAITAASRASSPGPVSRQAQPPEMHKPDTPEAVAPDPAPGPAGRSQPESGPPPAAAVTNSPPGQHPATETAYANPWVRPPSVPGGPAGQPVSEATAAAHADDAADHAPGGSTPGEPRAPVPRPATVVGEVAAPVAARPEAPHAPLIWTIQPGDSLIAIARAVYGRATNDTVSAILDANPNVSAADLIYAQDRLTLPEIPGTPFVTPHPPQATSVATPQGTQP